MTRLITARALKTTMRFGAATVAVLIASIVWAGNGAATEHGITTGSPPSAPQLPLPGQPGYPPVRSGPATASREILPNLAAQTPAVPLLPGATGYPPVRTVVIGGATHYELGFNSAFTNKGPGPMLVQGHRASTTTRDMTADQYIQLKGGSFALRPRVGALRFIKPVDSNSHNHWHYLGAEVYELYSAGHLTTGRRYQKQGFCMAEPSTVFQTYCGFKDPTELSQIEGMLAGTTDYYNAGVEGQAIDITGLPAGQYVLINWVDSQCLLKETTYGDNAAVSVLTLTYPAGKNMPPSVSVGAETTSAPHLPCPAPTLTSAQAKRYLRDAVVRKGGKSMTGLSFSCARVDGTEFSCNAKWSSRSTRFSGRITIAHVRSSILARYPTALSGISARADFVGRSAGRRQRWSLSMRLLHDVQPAHP